MSVETSLVIRFQDAVAAAAAGTVVAEIDSDHDNNKDENGNVKSVFDVDDKPVFLVHYDSSVLYISSISTSAGDTTRIGGPVSRQKESTVQFTHEDDTSSLSYINPTLASIDWYNNSCTFSIDGSELTPISGSFPCIGEGLFNVSFNDQYRLTPPTLNLEEGEEYKILIVITMGTL